MATKGVTVMLKLKTAFKAALGKAGSLLKGFAGKVKGLARGMAGGFKAVTQAVSAVVTGLAVGIGKLAQMQAKQAVKQAKLAAVLKATGFAAGFTRTELNKLGAELQETTGVADDLITGAQTMLGTFKQIKGDTFTRTTKAVLDMATVMEDGKASAAGLKAASIQLGKALNDPVKGIGALSRVGIQFTDAQKEQIRTMVEANDILGAQNIILTEVESQFGGAAKAASEADFGIGKFKNTLSDAGEALGKVAAETIGLEGILDGLRQKIKTLTESGQFQVWAEDAKEAFKAITEAGAGLVKTLRIDKILGAAKTGIQKAAAFLGGVSGSQGGFRERIAAGIEQARATNSESLAKRNKERLKQVQAEKKAQEEIVAEQEQREKKEGQINNRLQERLALEQRLVKERKKLADLEADKNKKERINNLKNEIKELDKAVAKREEIARMKIPEIVAMQKQQELERAGEGEEKDRLDAIRAKLKLRGVDEPIEKLTEDKIRGLKKSDREFIMAAKFRMQEQRQRDLDNAKKLIAQDKLKQLQSPEVEQLKKIRDAVENTEQKLDQLLIRK